MNRDLEALQRENVDLKRRLQDSGDKVVGDYDKKITALNKEIERLNGILKSKVSEA
jgi:phage host-nuclease inhibitor protein Gam